MEKKYVIVSLTDVHNAMVNPKLHVQICEIGYYYPDKGKMFYDSFEEAERMLMNHFNGINDLLVILPVYSSSIETFKERFRVH